MAIQFKKGNVVAIATLPASVTAVEKSTFLSQGVCMYTKNNAVGKDGSKTISIHLEGGARLIAPADTKVAAGDKVYYFKAIPIGTAIVDGADATMCYHYTQAGDARFESVVTRTTEDKMAAAMKEYGVQFAIANVASAKEV